MGWQAPARNSPLTHQIRETSRRLSRRSRADRWGKSDGVRPVRKVFPANDKAAAVTANRLLKDEKIVAAIRLMASDFPKFSDIALTPNRKKSGPDFHTAA